MSEGAKGPGRKGGRPEGEAAGSPPDPRRGALASYMGWIVSANVVALLALGVAVAALVFHITDEGGEGGLTGAAGQPTATVQPTATAPAVVEVSVDNAPSWGPEDAPVTIVEFSDYL